MSMHRPDFEFGRGKVTRNAEYFALPPEERAKILGWADSCPVVDELIESRGAQAMVERYGQVNAFFQIITREARKHNPRLAEQMLEHVPRKPDEPAGKYEPQSVPLSHTEIIPPMGTLPGYASSRLLIDQWGINDSSLSNEELRDRIHNGRVILHTAVDQAQTPAQFLAYLAEGAIQHDVEPAKVLKDILPIGWLEEHNGYSAVTALTRQLAQVAPTVWNTYSAMSSAEKAENGVVNLVTDFTERTAV